MSRLSGPPLIPELSPFPRLSDSLLFPKFPPLPQPPLLPELPPLPKPPLPLLFLEPTAVPCFFAVFDELCEALPVLIPLPAS